ncbi:MAG: hypothetical protein GZ089_06365 [Aromatoleum sp.]|nr:hypothetical protein [Aromatoleum sp.]
MTEAANEAPKIEWQRLLAVVASLRPTIGFTAPDAAETNQRIAFVEAQLQLILADIVKLQKENSALKEQRAKMQLGGTSQQQSAEFVEHRGALFKRLPSGGYLDSPTCPVCHSAMSAFHELFPFECGKPSCGQKAGFKGEDLKRVMSELPPNPVTPRARLVE